MEENIWRNPVEIRAEIARVKEELAEAASTLTRTEEVCEELEGLDEEQSVGTALEDIRDRYYALQHQMREFRSELQSLQEEMEDTLWFYGNDAM